MASFQAAVPLAAFLLAGFPVMVYFLSSIESMNSAITGSTPHDTRKDALSTRPTFSGQAILLAGNHLSRLPALTLDGLARATLTRRFFDLCSPRSTPSDDCRME